MKTLSFNDNQGFTVNYLTDLIGENQQFTVLQITTVTDGVEQVGLSLEAIILNYPDWVGQYVVLKDFVDFAEENSLNLIEASEENPLPIFIVDRRAPAPTVISAIFSETAPTNLVYTFSEELADIIPDKSAFTVEGLVVSSVSKTAYNEITVVVTESTDSTIEYLCTYMPPALNPLQGLFNNLVGLTVGSYRGGDGIGKPVTNLISVGVPGGIKLTWVDVAGTSGNVEIFASIDNAAYILLDTVNAGVQTYTHIISGTHIIKYKVRQEIIPISFVAQYQSIYDEYTTKPDSAVASEQNKMIKAIVDGSAWDSIAYFGLLASHAEGEALMNIRYPNDEKGIAVNSPVFTQHEGYVGNVAGTRYLNLKWGAVDDGKGICLVNDMSLMVAFQSTGTVGRCIGYSHFSSSYNVIQYQGRGCLNSAYATDFTALSANSKKYISIIRKGANDVKRYVNKDASENLTRVSAALGAGDWFALCNNQTPAGSPGDYSDSKISAIVIGNFTETQKNVIIDAIDAYLVSNGKGIL